jgi:hypothetical protein
MRGHIFLSSSRVINTDKKEKPPKGSKRLQSESLNLPCNSLAETIDFNVVLAIKGGLGLEDQVPSHVDTPHFGEVLISVVPPVSTILGVQSVIRTLNEGLGIDDIVEVPFVVKVLGGCLLALFPCLHGELH